MSTHTVNHSSCVKCELCVLICPAGIVSQTDTGEIFFRQDRVDVCIKCGHCMAMCGHKSISIEGLSYDTNFQALPGLTFDPAAFKNFLLTRRSVRVFQDRPVPRELLEEIVDMLSTVPFGVHPDNVQITVIKDKSLIEKAVPLMSAMYRQMHKLFRAPLLGWLILKSMPKEVSNTMKNFIMPHIDKGFYVNPVEVDDIARNAPAMILFHAAKGAEEHSVDAHICLTYALLAAHSLGLGATAIGLIGPAINHSKPLRKLFRIPDGNEVVEAMILGYPKYRFKHAIYRPKKNVTYLG
jgi:nitroreductase/Pyruvate/2-oxoacid:ferredoxin oxidoreductase delta subunit